MTNMEPRNESLTDEQRETLYLLAEALIPEHHEAPSADEAGVSGKFIDEVLMLRDDLAPEVWKLLDSAKGQDPREYCENLERENPGAFAHLTFVIAGAYLMSPKSRTWLSYSGQVGEYQDGSQQAEYLVGGILDEVRSRGHIYRPTPKEQEVE